MYRQKAHTDASSRYWVAAHVSDMNENNSIKIWILDIKEIPGALDLEDLVKWSVGLLLLPLQTAAGGGYAINHICLSVLFV